MKKFAKGMSLVEALILIVVAVGLVMAGSFVADFRKEARLDNFAMAAVTNPSTGSPGYMMVNLPIPGTATSMGVIGAKTGVVRFKMPWPATLLGVSGIYRLGTAAGTTISVDVTEAGTSVLSVPLVINSTSASEGTISDSTIADESLIGINHTVVGGGTVYNPAVQLIFKRK